VAEGSTLPIHRDQPIANKHIGSKARSCDGSMEGSTEAKKGTSFEEKRVGIVVRGPPQRLHPPEESENFARSSEVKGAPYELVPPENGRRRWREAF